MSLVAVNCAITKIHPRPIHPALYSLQVAESTPSPTWRTVLGPIAITAPTGAEIPHLQAGTDYLTRIVATFRSTDAAPDVVVTGAPVTFKTLPGCPSVPSGVSISSVTKSAMKVRWDVPHNGGAAPVDFEVLLMAETAPPVTKSATTAQTNYTCAELLAGTFYNVSIRARNPVGASEWSRPERVETQPGGAPI